MSDELKNNLQKLHDELLKEFSVQFDRSLSFQDMLFDRWEKASTLGFGEKSSIYQDSLVIGDVEVGANSWIGPFTVLDGSGGLKIGDNCSISTGVQIYTHDTVMKRLSDGALSAESKPTSIGESCYIGPNAVISKGISIGHHSILGSQSFLNINLEPYSVAFGVPASIMGKVNYDEAGVPSILWQKSSLEKRIIDLEKNIRALQLKNNQS